ncbi:MAG TPA: metalloregulator ArsR/SmtB family transcription factor [Vicinamibacterales bacterium]|nr:metalloregulator ArsR/SmtB family transcription factor [Vicinamibacterales bacterium]
MNSDHSAQLDALGDGTRRAILARLLKDGPLPVGELAREFPMSRPAISQHLRILKRADLVTDRAEGARRLYAINPEALASLRAYFDRFWTEALTAFKRRVEAPAAKRGSRTHK